MALEGMASENPEVSVFQSNLPVREKLERARTELLDLSARNRLLNMPRSSKNARTVEIVDEKSEEIFRLLVLENRPFTFLAGKAATGDGSDVKAASDDAGIDEYEIVDLALPEDDERDERGVFARHSDTRLQTRLTPKGLQKRLLDLYFDARTLEEEQGVNILFLTLGALKWIDPANAANIRFAPLILLPVALERGNAGEKFKLRVRPEDFASNLSLEAFLDRVHGIKLPTFDATENFDLLSYFAGVADAVTAKPGWAVLNDEISLGFFSFAKFLMYRDLDPDNWPAHHQISERMLVRGLLSDGFDSGDGMIAEDAKVDPFIAPADMLHIVDSDSSQTLAVHEVRRGRDMVIQGPPGTGKSQTIANIIASAIADGKSVLFVAEKMAALEVVKRRLDATGVGHACLELHSNKANKRAVLEELRRTWELGAPKGQKSNTLFARLTEARDRLNDHAARMHRPHPHAALTPYQVVGQLARLHLDGERPNEIELFRPESWTEDGFNERHLLLTELVERVEALGQPMAHPWYGVGLSAILPADAHRLTERIAQLEQRLADMDRAQNALSQNLEQPPVATLDELPPLILLAHQIAGAPALSAAALGSTTWTDKPGEIEALLGDGRTYRSLRQDHAAVITADGWSADIDDALATLAALPDGFSRDGFAHATSLTDLLPRMIEEAEQLARVMGSEAPMNILGTTRTMRIAERVAAAPKASTDAFSSDIWDDGVDRAADIAAAVCILEDARRQIAGKVSDTAWAMDLGEARTTLAAHGTGFFRMLSSSWRQADRLVRSILTDPAQPLEATLSQLDMLARGQAARALIQNEEAFGRDAFGADWRGERTAAEPLTTLVAWMRSTSDLGREPRLVAATRPDRVDIDLRAARLRSLLDRAAPLAQQFFDAVRADSRKPGRSPVFGDAPSADYVDIAALLMEAAKLDRADNVGCYTIASIPAGMPQYVALLRTVQQSQALERRIEGANSLGVEAFGASWQGIDSDWDDLTTAAQWIRENSAIRLLASRIADRADASLTAGSIAAERDSLLADLDDLTGDLRLDMKASLGVGSLGIVPIKTLGERLSGWSRSGEKLFNWVAYRDRADRSRALGCGEVVVRLEDGRLAAPAVVPAFEMAYYEALYADMVEAEPELGRFDGDLHGRLARDFADLDQQRIASASFEVVQVHHQHIPARDGGAIGPLGVLRGEIAKKRGHMPIRRLMERAGPAVQALKPVFMMSPLSVAQFLTPGIFEFDLLVMDEASQIQPVDALGAVARAKQVVVVGDPKQLPPTAFFSKMTGGDADADDDEGTRVADIESILGLFTARGLPTRMLRWHYRSRHQSLIAVSNRQFYESKLFIVPSPYTGEAGMGLRFHHIPNGVFDTGGTRTNIIEAKIVAQAIIAHARNHPALSLGVATFSVSQRRAILDQLELLRRTLSPEDESFFQAHPSEPFFVKNLENVQGDERDVILISVGYGPSVPGGRVPMRFGPLGSEGGERRLNVLISRAKQRCEVFASITDEDIEPDFAASRKGVFAFRLFMHYARTGNLTMGATTGRDHDSVFEAQVGRALQERGYHVHRQVGLAGFFIDLAVSDPDRPGRYILGVECDGAAYHDARSARDRDRLRQSVLESHGWTIHRVWSTDWFQRPSEQLELIIARVEAAKAELATEAAGNRLDRAVPVDIVTVEREEVTEIGLAPADTSTTGKTYVEAELVRPGHVLTEIHDTPRGTISSLAEQVVAIEGPVHIDEVINRIRDAWGLKRAGGRIQEAVDHAVDVSVRMARIQRDGDFLSVPGAVPLVRDRSAVRSPTLRKPDTLPPAEIEIAIVDIVRAHLGATDDQIALAVSRAVGFKSTSPQLRTLILERVEQAIAKRWIARYNGTLVLGPDVPAIRSAPVAEPSPIVDLIAEGEHERLEFKETLRWDVELAQQNKKLEDLAVKTLAGFANKDGGTLLIGVADNGDIMGLDRDYECLGGNQDKMELHLTNLLSNQFGSAFRASRIRITFPWIGGQQVCRVDIDPAQQPTFVKIADRAGNVLERFYVRTGNATWEFSGSQMAAHIQERYGS